MHSFFCVFFFQAEDGIRDIGVTGVQTCALPISYRRAGHSQRDSAYPYQFRVKFAAHLFAVHGQRDQVRNEPRQLIPAHAKCIFPHMPAETTSGRVVRCATPWGSRDPYTGENRSAHGGAHLRRSALASPRSSRADTSTRPTGRTDPRDTSAWPEVRTEFSDTMRSISPGTEPDTPSRPPLRLPANRRYAGTRKIPDRPSAREDLPRPYGRGGAEGRRGAL